MATTLPLRTGRRLIEAVAVGRAAVVVGSVLAVHGALLAVSRTGLPRRCNRAVADGEVVLVPGFRLRANGRLPFIARWRCRIAVRSTDVRRARFLFSGGAVVGPRSEASAMAEYAVRRLGVPRERILLEEASRTTEQNVACSIPLLEHAPVVRVASQPLHALRVRRHLARQAPAIAARLGPAREVVLAESILFGPWQILHEARRRLRDRP